MSIEIERKFLLKNDDWRRQVISHHKITQGYLSTDPHRIVRIRIIEGENSSSGSARLTIKGAKAGASCPEFEYPIPLEDAQEMLRLCEVSLSKIRHIVPCQNSSLDWEVDVFTGVLSGLIVAEIELPSEDFKIKLPEWIGEEVTTDSAYANSNLYKRGSV